MTKILIALLLNLFSLDYSASEGISEAKEYTNNSKMQKEWSKESLKNFPIEKNDKILDVCCGDGKTTALIAENVPKGIVVGLDISKEMIAYAAERYTASNLFFLQGNLETTAFNEQFDKVVSFMGLQWVMDQKAALKSIRKSLKNGGKILIVIPGKSPCNVGYVADELVKSEKWAPLFENYQQQRIYFNADEYLVLLNEAKLEATSVQTLDGRCSYKNRDELLDYIKPLINFIDHLTKKQKRDFINDFVDKTISYSDSTSPDGSIIVPMVKLEIIARKPK